MNTKKKILISIISILLVAIVAFGISFLIGGNKKEKIIEIENPYTISYFANEMRTEGFTVKMPQDFSEKILVSIDEPAENLQSYKFKHLNSGEVLFIIYISQNEAHKKLSGEYEIIDTIGDYTYVWTQSLSNNEYILDEAKRNEFNEMAKYYNTIRSTIEIISSSKIDKT